MSDSIGSGRVAGDSLGDLHSTHIQTHTYTCQMWQILPFKDLPNISILSSEFNYKFALVVTQVKNNNNSLRS